MLKCYKSRFNQILLKLYHHSKSKGFFSIKNKVISLRNYFKRIRINVRLHFFINVIIVLMSIWRYNQNRSTTVDSSLRTKSTKRATTSKSKCILFRIIVLLISTTLLTPVSSTATPFHTNSKYGTNTIKTKYGLLRGIVVRSSPLVEAFLGIPYASPPIGSLRFMPPITPSPWKNIRNADRFSPVCPQIVPMPPNGPEALLEVPRARLVQFRRLLPLLGNQSEDCLYLNIYAPIKSTQPNNSYQTHSKLQHTADTANLSTILYIHGESYEWNSGNPYDGSELAARGNVIVVTINFRLGILGFLKTGGKESAQGNFGLMDLVAGLHWLKENLPAFGGDSNKIAVMGHGTGAALANILLVSPVSSDLIKRAILVSGSALSPWAIQKFPLLVKRRVAEQTGCHGDLLIDDLAPCLRTKKLSELLAVKIDYPRFLAGFAPFVDGTVISLNRDVFKTLKLPTESAILSASGIEFANFPKQDLIFALTSVESYLDLSAQDLEFGLNETRKDRILRTYVRNVFRYHLNEIFAVLKNEYTDWEKAIRNPLSSRDATLSFLSDGHTASHLIKIGYMHNLCGGKSYFLHFKHKTEEDEYPMRSGSVRGEDVPFWFGLPVSPLFPQNYSSQERNLSLIMVKHLSNFVKTGDPNNSSDSNMNNEELTSEESEDLNHSFRKRSNLEKHLEINNTALVKTFHREEKSSTVSSNLNSIEYEHKILRRKRSNLQFGHVKFKRNMGKEALFRNAKLNRKHTNSVTDMLNDEMDKRSHGSDSLPFWETYDSVNQLYLELGNDAGIHSHYRGHKLSMWLNLIPQLHKHTRINEMPLKHHQFTEDNAQLFDGVVRPYLQNMPLDDEGQFSIKTLRSMRNSAKPPVQSDASSFQQEEFITDCGINTTQFDNVVFHTTFVNSSNSSENLPNVLGNLEVLRRLTGKQLQSYTAAFMATVAVGCFLLVLNVIIFAGIYHQREKRAKDNKKKEQLEEHEIFLNIPAKSALSIDCPQTETEKLSPPGSNFFDQNTSQSSEKDHYVDTENKMFSEMGWVCSTTTLDLLNIKSSRDNLSGSTCSVPHDNTPFKHDSHDGLIQKTHPSPKNEMSYQEINDPSGSSKSDGKVFDNNNPKLLSNPTSKPNQQNQGGILRIAGGTSTNSGNKKRVFIQEISV
ncbi:uncharacterized protein LOC129905603 [Episyrphus balteatus]|uniref:uncharacterized protein LOC129905603 n=1 Tax=Episyrphus balteatus TaxID=286459 RepID=UPI002485C797|nr:uncharacterized protein LOC129905603 [Episyrphus balteatus]XP_055837105.1 uncharacterized protein LOC129905603 [Episyrphus balteatus]